MSILCLPYEQLAPDTLASTTVIRAGNYAVSIDVKVRIRELVCDTWTVTCIGEDGEYAFGEKGLAEFVDWLTGDTDYSQEWASFQALAVILYNEADETLHFWLPGNSYLSFFFARDRGYYFSTRTNEIRSLVQGRLKPPDASRFLLCYQFVPGTDTHLENISKAGAGQIIDFDMKGQQVAIRPKIETHTISDEFSSENRIVDQLYTDFLAVLEQQTASFDRVGVLLGGFDSALIISGLRQLGKDIKAYTFKYDNGKYNQAHIDDVTNRFRIEHEWIPINQDDYRDGLIDYAHLYDQPVTQPHYLIYTMKAMRKIEQDGMKLCLTGDGCDGVFFGYPTVYRKFRLLNALSRLPGFIYKGVGIFFKSTTLEKWIGHPYRMLRHILQALSRKPEIVNFMTAAAIDPTTFNGLWNSSYNIQTLDDRIYGLWEKCGKPDPVRAAYLGKNMVGLNKAKLSSCFNETGVTLKTPFLHPLISQYAKMLSPEYWVSTKDRKVASGKYLLTKMAIEKSMLGEDIVYQKKMSPVSSPVDMWIKTPLNRELLQIMTARDNSMNPSFLQSLLREKLTEKLYKKYVTIDDYTSHVTGFLASYLSYRD